MLNMKRQRKKREEIFPCTVNNGNRTEWSPIRSVIIRVINKIGRPMSDLSSRV